jgi:hypothetical protein
MSGVFIGGPYVVFSGTAPLRGKATATIKRNVAPSYQTLLNDDDGSDLPHFNAAAQQFTPLFFEQVPKSNGAGNPIYKPLLGEPWIIFCRSPRLPTPPGMYAQEGGDTAHITGKVLHMQVIEWPDHYGAFTDHPHMTTDWPPRPHHIAARRRFGT